MANINQKPGSQNFKQIEGDGWLSTYFPAICAGVMMTAVLFFAVSCAKKSEQSANKISAPQTPAVSSPATAAPAVTAEAPKKVVKKQRPTTATYVNGTYGVSFSYPRKYSLQSAAKKDAPMPVPANFVKPGAVEIASVDLPDTLYPETDFSSALLNVSVTPNMTAEDCSQFAPAATKADANKPESIKLGSNQFTVLEQTTGEQTHQSDVKFFHMAKNGACYEFALDVETSRKPDEDLAQVERGKVFQQLAKILTTARIKDVELPETVSAQKATSDAKEVAEKPATSAPETKAEMKEAQTVNGTNVESTEKAQVVQPQQK